MPILERRPNKPTKKSVSFIIVPLLTNLRLRNPMANKSPEDRKVLAICLAVAFAFWLLLKLSKEYEQAVVFSIDYDLPIGKAFADTPPATATVMLKASGWTFIKMMLRPQVATIRYPVQDAEVFVINPNTLRTALGARLYQDADIVDIRYDAVSLPLASKSVRRLPIVVPQRIDFLREYGLLDTPRIEPDSIWVSGPSSILDTLRFWATDSLVIEDLSQDLSTILSLNTPAQGLTVENKTVTVTIRVQRFTEKTFQLPIGIYAPALDSVRIFPERATVKCIVGLQDYARLSSDDFSVVANVQAANAGASGNTVLLELARKPDYIQSYTITPRAISYLIQQ